MLFHGRAQRYEPLVQPSNLYCSIPSEYIRDKTVA